jgi:DDE domain
VLVRASIGPAADAFALDAKISRPTRTVEGGRWGVERTGIRGRRGCIWPMEWRCCARRVLSSWSPWAGGQSQMDHYGRMDAASSSLYKGYRFPLESISHCVWLYHRFPLSLREVEEMMMKRGVIVSYETIRAWCRTFGQVFANGLRRRRPCPGDRWHLDEVFIKIQGKQHYLWRAVDQHGTVLDILVTSRRDAQAATALEEQRSEK